MNMVKAGQSVVSQFNLPLEPGDTVSVNLTREFQEFQHRRLRLVYEDEHIIVVHKGYGLLSMAGDGRSLAARNCISSRGSSSATVKSLITSGLNADTFVLVAVVLAFIIYC